MIKKAIHIILTMLLLISTIGITISKHYSGDELFSVALFGDAESCCEGPCDCCSDETYFYQLVVDYVPPASVNSPHIQKINSPFLFAFYRSVLLFDSSKTTSILYFDDTSPTFIPNTAALLQVFRC